MSAAELVAVRASNEFGFDLLRRLLEQTPDSTVFISPLSASIALAMTLNGAAGLSYDGMRSALRLDGLEQEQINQGYSDLLDLLEGLDQGVTLRIANGIWHQPWAPLRDDFVDRVEGTFSAAIRPFTPVEPEAEINAWVREATDGLIEEIAPSPLRPEVVAMLLNAVYFKAGWVWPFDENATAPGPFYSYDGSTREVQFMSQRLPIFNSYGTETYTAADLPYARQAFAMTIVVPSEETTVHDLVAGLDNDAWKLLTDSMGQEWPAFVELPRFKLQWGAQLNDPLKAMGMEAAFTPGVADFSRMFESSGSGGWIEDVTQKTFLRVDELGSEAAAATNVTIAQCACYSTIRADRPFLIAIRERFTGTILFIGAVIEPPLD